MPHAVSRADLARYLAGETSPEETRQIRAWLAAHPKARLALEGLDHPDAAARRDPERALARLRPHLHEQRHGAPRRPAPAADRPAGTRPPTVRHIAAVLVLALGGLLGYSLLVTDVPAFREIATAPGERTRVTLADGTTVELNVASRLRVPTAFGDTTRVVYLEGEAFFDVAPDPAHPFVIHAGAGVARVLGTAFNVNAYPAEEDVAVVVVEGRVSLRADAHPEAAVLHPGERGRLVPGAAVAVDRVPPDAYLAWRSGRLVFTGTPLREVARVLARWYGLDAVHVDDAVGMRRLDAAFTDEPLPDVLRTIAAALEVTYHMEGRTVRFSRP